MTKQRSIDFKSWQKSTLIGRCLYLTRNLEAQVFTAAMTTSQSEALKHQLKTAVFDLEALRSSGICEKNMRERHIQIQYLNQGILLSDPLKLNLDIGVLTGEGDDIGLCVNDVDHIRWFCKQANKNFEELWQTLDLLDDELGTKITYAYQDPFGYLTSKLENLGTGLVGEAILHLPALHYTGFIESLAESVGAIGVQIKPLKNSFYKVYNSVTLGRREIEIVTLLDQVVEKLIERENAGRETLLASNPNKWRDKIARSYGLAQYAVSADESEVLCWFSDILLGIGFGMFALKADDERTGNGSNGHGTDNWMKDWYNLQDNGIEGFVGRALRPSEKLLERPKVLRGAINRWQWRG